MLQVQAVFPRVHAARILVHPAYALPEVCQRTKRRAGRGKDAAAKRVVECVEGRDVVVLRRDECGIAAEAILTRSLKRCRGKPADASPKNRIGAQPVRKSNSWLELREVAFESTSLAAIHS